MIITEPHRIIIYDIMLIVCMILAGYTLGLKLYTLSFMFIAIAILSHSRLYRILEIKEVDISEEFK